MEAFCGWLNLAALVSLAALIFTRIAQPQMREIISNDLSLKFPGRSTKDFPHPWPDRDLPKKNCKTRFSCDSRAIFDYRKTIIVRRF
jgi:hypothetical protein